MRTERLQSKLLQKGASLPRPTVGAGGAPSSLDCSNTNGENKPQLYNWKMYESETNIEIYRYEFPVLRNGKSRTKSKNQSVKTISEVEDKERKLKSLASSLSRTKNTFRRLVNLNFQKHDKFLTLTFADTNEFDIRNVNQCNNEFRKFIKRMKYRFGNFTYICAIEFQDKNDRGAVHYHVLYKLPFIDQETIEEIWGNGFIWVTDIGHIQNKGSYMTKYLSKNYLDLRLFGEKRFFASKNLKRHRVIIGKKAEDKFYEIIGNGGVPKYHNKYTTVYSGRTKFYEFEVDKK